LPSFLHSLRFQIGIALSSLISVFIAFALYALTTIEGQHLQNNLIKLADTLHLTVKNMSLQAMTYEENAPRDYPTYFRDLNLYYKDLMMDTAKIEQINQAFSNENFAALFELQNYNKASLMPASKNAAAELNVFWQNYLKEINDELGSDKNNPRLEFASKYISQHGKSLSEKTKKLQKQLQQDIFKQREKTDFYFKLSIFISLIIAVSILFWFYKQVLKPLEQSMEGFNRVSQGDFGFNVAISTRNEIGWLTSQFNQLSKRLDKLFKLTTTLQEGSDLDSTLKFVADNFPDLLPLNWVGILFSNNNNKMHLDKAYCNGKPEQNGASQFLIEGTLLEQCLNNNEPLHISDIAEVSQLDPAYQFIHFLAEKGQRDVIFLPVTEHSPVPGILVFSARKAHSYTAEHLKLMSNLATVITLSFGKTLKLAEQQRLATIGEFASSIAHEIRSPLATVDLALDYLTEQDLSTPASKRVALANMEVKRISNLLEDMLLYAKPLKIETNEISLVDVINHSVISMAEQLKSLHKKVTLIDSSENSQIQGDKNRLIQVFINLINNAIEATQSQDEITIEILNSDDQKRLLVNIINHGQPISNEHLDKIFDPFFTTKSHGTGLGLPIIKKIVTAHGGDIDVNSKKETTTFSLQFSLV